MSMGIVDRRTHRRARKTELPSPELQFAPADPVHAAVLDAVSQTERQRLAWAQDPDGPEGEHIAATSLDILGRYGWTALREERWPGIPDPEVIHVAVGPGGVVVVKEEAWTGHVVVDDGVLRHNGFRCEKSLEQLSAATGAITSLLQPEHRTAVTGVIFVTPRDMEAQTTGGVHLVGRLHLASLLVGLPQRLTPIDVADITRDLSRALGTPVTTVPVSGGGAVSASTVFFPAPTSDTAAYFTPRPTPQMSVEMQPEPEPELNPATGLPLYRAPMFNRFGIRETPAMVPTPYPASHGRGNRRRDVTGLTLLLLAALMTVQHNEQIAVAVDGWLSPPSVTMPAQAVHEIELTG